MSPGLIGSPILRLHHPATGSALPPTAELFTFLDRVERRRADRYATPARAAAFITGRYLLRLLAAGLVGADPRVLVSDFGCPVCGRTGTRPDAPLDSRPDHGRPGYLLDGEPLPLALSLSRSADVVLLGALDLDLDLDAADQREPRCTGSRTGITGTATSGRESPPTGIGVDVDVVGGVRFQGFDDVALTEAERNHVLLLPQREQDDARARLWVRKEALVKARGTGFGSAGPSDVEVLIGPGVTDLEECSGVTLARLGLVAAVAVV